MPDPVEYETTNHLPERQGVTTRTIDRWVGQGILPKPVKINGRKYWPVDTEPRRDTAANDGATA